MNALLKTLKDNLGTDFTPPVKKAWKIVAAIIQETMISDNYEKP
jgi:hemoglobin-like flavoprotein